MSKIIPALKQLMVSFAATVAIMGAVSVGAAEIRAFDIPAGELSAALTSLAKQTGLELIFQPGDLRGIKTQGVKGSLSPEAAIAALLKGTSLKTKTDVSGAILISVEHRGAQAPEGAQATDLRLAQLETKSASMQQVSSAARNAESAQEDSASAGIPEILVTGSKVLNIDVKRTRDDPQPYVVFDRKTLAQSGAQNLEEFLKQRLPMNTQAGSQELTVNSLTEGSQLNLRGLGTNQTLVLVDGRRLPNRIDRVTPTQPDINGLPMAAIERVEVLPSTASGIYGGNAIGGVINIVLRRDYSGAELSTNYENTFGSDAATRRVDLSYGASFNEGKSNFLLGGSYVDHNHQLLNETNLMERGFARVLENNPAAILTAATPPLGRTTNVRSVSGANLTFKTNGQSIGSYMTHLPTGYAGFASDNGAALIANAGRYNYTLTQTEQYRGGGQAIASNPTIKSAMASIRHHLTSRVELFGDFGASSTESRYPFSFMTGGYTLAPSAPTNPFNESIRVAVPVITPGEGEEFYRSNDDLRAVGGVIVQLPAGWVTSADYTWVRAESQFRQPSSTSDPRSAASIAAVSSGAINVMRDVELYPIDWSPYLGSSFLSLNPFETTTREISARVSGPLARLPAGNMTLSALLQHREDLFGATYGYSSGNNLLYPDRSQEVKSAYVEFGVPVFSNPTGGAIVRKLDLQVAGRFDDHTTRGSTGLVTNGVGDIIRTTNETESFNPTFAAMMQLGTQVSVRGSYGKGFRPPAVHELIRNPLGTNPITSGTDPLRGNTAPGPYFNQQGGNPDLKPEESTALSAGIVLTPEFISGLRMSVDWSRIKKTNDIVSLTNQQTIDNEALLPGRVTRGPRLSTDPVGWAGPITQIDTTRSNLSSSEIEAYDVQLDYSLSTDRFGQFDFFSVATWQTHYLTQIISSAPVVENVGITSSYPLKFKGNLGVSWKYRQWTVGWFTRYLDSYRVSTDANTTLNQGNGGQVSSQMYHDVMIELPLSFGQANSDNWLRRVISDTNLQLGVKNVFDKAPSFDALSLWYYSPYGDPRGARYYATLRKQF